MWLHLMGPESGVEGPACGWETTGDWWAIKTFQCPCVYEALSSLSFALCLLFLSS